MTIVVLSCAFVVLYHFVLYPVTLVLLGKVAGRKFAIEEWKDEDLPSVTVLVPCYNEREAIREKLVNLKSQEYPEEKLDIIVAADGPDGKIGRFIEDLLDDRVRFIEYPKNRGKAYVLNDTAPQCRGDIVVFTDATAQFESDAVRQLVARFREPGVGGVCGYHQVAGRKSEQLSGAQGLYWRFDGLVKRAEDRLSSISSCYGSIYAIRRELFTPVLPWVTDDAYQAMSIVRQGWRFAFAPEARAWIPPRAKSPAHEIRRRRRVVARSLWGLWASRELFDIRRFGLYSLTLFSHKALRRLVPILLLLLLIASFVMARENPVWTVLLVGQLLSYGGAFADSHGWLNFLKGFAPLRKVISVNTYFVLGQLGTLLGTLDFLRGRKIDRWVPVQR